MRAFHRGGTKRPNRGRNLPPAFHAHRKEALSVDAFVGERLAAARSAAGLSVAGVAALTGVSQTRLADYESGARRTPPLVLHNLACLYGQALSYFFGVTEASPVWAMVQPLAPPCD